MASNFCPWIPIRGGWRKAKMLVAIMPCSTLKVDFFFSVTCCGTKNQKCWTPGWDILSADGDFTWSRMWAHSYPVMNQLFIWSFPLATGGSGGGGSAVVSIFLICCSWESESWFGRWTSSRCWSSGQAEARLSNKWIHREIRCVQNRIR